MQHKYPGLDSFVKKHDCLVCIDSDGTAIDAMNVKHKRCHGPSFVEEWGLDDRSAEVLAEWERINLYESTRGVNRFIALAEMLERMQGKYLDTPDLDALRQWVISTPELSNRYLEKEIQTNGAEVLKKALRWSLALNQKIAGLCPADKPPFEGVTDFLASAAGKVDIAVISSSNMDAIVAEWGYYDMLRYVDAMTSQEIGTKAECIARMLEKGYAANRVLMLGDAYPDVDAARENGVYYYPILIGHEAQSWRELKDVYLDEFVGGRYGTHSQRLLKAFLDNFGAA